MTRCRVCVGVSPATTEKIPAPTLSLRPALAWPEVLPGAGLVCLSVYILHLINLVCEQLAFLLPREQQTKTFWGNFPFLENSDVFTDSVMPQIEKILHKYFPKTLK